MLSTRLTASRPARAGSSWSLGGGQRDSTSSAERQPLRVCRRGGEQRPGADALVLAIDVDAVCSDWGAPDARAVPEATPEWWRERSFASGSMGPKVQAGCRFVKATGGGSVIGQVDELTGLIEGTGGTVVAAGQAKTGRGTARTSELEPVARIGVVCDCACAAGTALARALNLAAATGAAGVSCCVGVGAALGLTTAAR